MAVAEEFRRAAPIRGRDANGVVRRVHATGAVAPPACAHRVADGAARGGLVLAIRIDGAAAAITALSVRVARALAVPRGGGRRAQRVLLLLDAPRTVGLAAAAFGIAHVANVDAAALTIRIDDAAATMADAIAVEAARAGPAHRERLPRAPGNRGRAGDPAAPPQRGGSSASAFGSRAALPSLPGLPASRPAAPVPDALPADPPPLDRRAMPAPAVPLGWSRVLAPEQPAQHASIESASVAHLHLGTINRTMLCARSARDAGEFFLIPRPLLPSAGQFSPRPGHPPCRPRDLAREPRCGQPETIETKSRRR